MQIDLVYFAGCPHVTSARERLRAALASAHPAASWNEWDSGAATTPAHLRVHSSPTVLVNGIDVERKSLTHGAGCALGGGPSLDLLRDVLSEVVR